MSDHLSSPSLGLAPQRSTARSLQNVMRPAASVTKMAAGSAPSRSRNARSLSWSRDVARHAEQLHGSSAPVAHDRTFDRNPALSAGVLLLGAGCEAVLDPATAARAPCSREHAVQIGKIAWMDLGPHLSEGLRWRTRLMPVIAPVAHVILELAASQVQAPGPELGTIEGQLQPAIAFHER